MTNSISRVDGSALCGPVPDSARHDPQVPMSGSLRDALNGLAGELSALGWTSRLRALPGRPLGLRVSNPEPGAAALSEDIYAMRGACGQWEFWWPWDERIAVMPADAAAVIVRVLRPAETR